MHEAQPATGIPSESHVAWARRVTPVRVHGMECSVPLAGTPAAMQAHKSCVVPVHTGRSVVNSPRLHAVVGIAVVLDEFVIAPPLYPAVVAHLVAPGHAHVVPPVAGVATAVAVPVGDGRRTGILRASWKCVEHKDGQ